MLLWSANPLAMCCIGCGHHQIVPLLLMILETAGLQLTGPASLVDEIDCVHRMPLPWLQQHPRAIMLLHKSLQGLQ